MPERALHPVALPAAAPASPACPPAGALPVATFRVAYRPRPFSPNREIVDLPCGLTVAAALERLVPDPALRRHAVVSVRGTPVPGEWWPRLRVKAGQLVSVTVVPRGSGFLRLALTMAIVAAAITATVLTGGVAGALLGAGISMGGMLALNALIPPPAPDLGQKQKSPTYQLTGSTNQATPWQVVPRIFGRHKFLPKKCADDIADIQGNDQWLVSLFCWGYGPLQVDGLKIGDSSVDNFDSLDIQTVDGSSGAAPSFDHYPTVAATATFQKGLRKDSGWVTSTTALNTDSAVVEITFPGGLIRYSKSSGNDDDEEVDFQIQWSPVGQNAWTGVPDLDVNAKTTSTLRKTVDITFPSRAQYDVRIQRTTDDHDGETDRQMASYWTALRSRTNLPPVNLGGVAYTCVHVKAQDQLSGTLNDFSGIVTSVAPDWTAGSGAWVARATRNPASLFRLLLQGQGAHDPVPDAEIDLPALQDWHEFCIAQGYACDYVLDQETTLWEAARIIAATGRASPTRASGKWSVVIDRPQATPVTILTPRNVKSFKGARVFVDYPHALRAQFVDSGNDYQTDERLVYADGYGDAAMVAANPSLTLATKFAQWQLPGVTSADLVHRFGRYHLACARLQPETYEFECDWEWIVFQRGDLIHAVHDVPEWGVAAGRVTAVAYAGTPASWSDAAGGAAGWTDAVGAAAAWSTQFGGALGNLASVDIDELVQMAPGLAYVVRVRRADGSQGEWPVKTVPGGTRRLTPDAAVPASAVPGVGDLVAVGVAGSATVPLLVKGISPASGLDARVTCIPYAPAVYTADTEAIPPWNANITAPPGTAVPIITHLRSDETVLNRDADGSVHVGILVSLYNDGSRPLTSIVAVEVEYRVQASGAPFRTVIATADASEVMIPAAEVDVTYEVAARYRLSSGKTGAWCPLQTHKVQGALIPPPDVAAIYNSGDRVSWLFAAPPDFAGFRVKTTTTAGQSWDEALAVSDGLYTVDYVLYSELPDGAAEILVKGETTAGVQAVNPGRLALTSVGAAKAVTLFTEDVAAEGFPTSDLLAPVPVTYTNASAATVRYTNAAGQAVTYSSGDTVASAGYEIVGGVLQATDQSAWLSPPAGPWLGPSDAPWLAGAFSGFTYTFQYTCPAKALPTDRIRLEYVADGEVYVLVRWADGAVVRFADTDPIPAGTVTLPPGWVPLGSLPGPGSSNPFVPWRNGVRPIAGDTLEFQVIGRGGAATRPAIRALAVLIEADLRTAVFGDLAVAAGGTQVLLPAGYRVASWVHVTAQVPATAASFGFVDKGKAGGPSIAGYDAAGNPAAFVGDVTVGYA